MFLLPMWPAMRTPLITREGVADWPIEPGARTLCEPCVTGPREKPWRLTVPAKPLPLERPLTLIASPGLEALDRHDLARGELECAAELVQVAMRGDVVLAQMPALGLGELALGHLEIGELDRVVAVVRLGLDLRDGARPGLDHGDGDAAARPP